MARQFTTTTSAMFSFLRFFATRQTFIKLTDYDTNSPIYIRRFCFDLVSSIYQNDVGTDKQRTHLCKGEDVYVVRETPEEIFRLLNN